MKQTLLTIAAFFAFASVEAQQVYLSPQPQMVVSRNNAATFSLSQTYQLRSDRSLEGGFALARLAELMPNQVKKASTEVIIGLKGDKSVKKFAAKIPTKAEGYYLLVEDGRIVIAASDERGAYYAIQTLAQMNEDGKVANVEITDYPDIQYRGVVEGFYGTPWSHAARLRQLDFYGANKMNVYLYGPKDDPYHSVPNWRKDYPAKEAEQIKELVDRAKKNGVIFYWAIHPGQDIKWTNEDRDNLVRKFESMYALGVRAFAVFFDDISGEGTKADRQAELLNYLDNNFVQKKKDVAPLVMCPTEYNKAWSNEKGGYLSTLGTKLNQTINVMWTGNSVIACIDKPTMEWINKQLQRKAYIWWNFPVSDYVRDHLLLGPVYGNSLDIKNDMSGFVSNPMERAEASKVALYSVADYSWNLEKFNSQTSWEHSLANLLPSQYEAFKTFATHSSDLGQNGHGFRREESTNIEGSLNRMVSTNGTDEAAIYEVVNECAKLSKAADLLLECNDNPALIDEIRPWLQQAKNVAEYGQSVIGMNGSLINKNTLYFEKFYKQARDLQTEIFNLDQAENQNPYQPGVKVGSKLLFPSLNALYTYVTKEYNKQNNTQLETVAEYQPYHLTSDVPQLANLPVRYKGKTVNINPSNEVIKWAAGGSVELSAEKTMILTGLSFDLGTKSIATSFKLEASVDGQNWKQIDLVQNADQTRIGTTNGIQGMEAVKIRLTNISGKALEVYFKNFQFTKK